jgi:O-antigen/teichoic acid export membrane protein
MLGGVVALMTVLLAIIAWQAELIIAASVGSSYAPAVGPLRVVCLGLVFASASTLMNASMQGLGFERAVASLSGVVSGCVLLGVGIGAHLGAASGAAIGLSTAYLVQCALTAGVFARALRQRAAPSEP